MWCVNGGTGSYWVDVVGDEVGVMSAEIKSDTIVYVLCLIKGIHYKLTRQFLIFYLWFALAITWLLVEIFIKHIVKSVYTKLLV